MIDKDMFISNSRFDIKGKDNFVSIGCSGFINGLQITIEGDNNSIYIGDNIFILDKTKLIAVDGSTIRIGNGCMFSDNIDIRTTDNHAIIDRKTGKRINYEEDIEFGNNVWIGTRVNILKGVHLADGTIVGAGSVVTNDNPYPNTIIAGNPAKKIKENVDWKMERTIK